MRRLLGTPHARHVSPHEEMFYYSHVEDDGLIQEVIEDETHGTKEAVVAYIGLENEIRLCGDGGLQAALSLRKHVARKEVELFMIALYVLCH
jgi:hypothetical protein